MLYHLLMSPHTSSVLIPRMDGAPRVLKGTHESTQRSMPWSRSPSPTHAVVVGTDSPLAQQLLLACEALGLISVVVTGASEAAAAVRRFDSPLVIVLSEHLQTSPTALLEALLPSVPRLVLLGPRFGGIEHVLALEVGFHEVWPANVTPVAMNALLRASVQSPRRVTPKQAATVGLGDLVIDLTGMTCFDGERPILLSASHMQTLALLLRRTPDVVSREELRSTIPSISSDKAPLSRVVDVHVSRVRRQLQAEGVTSLSILGVRNRGYRVVRA
jgi:DNA-binding response OmpR family regulator